MSRSLKSWSKQKKKRNVFSFPPVINRLPSDAAGVSELRLHKHNKILLFYTKSCRFRNETGRRLWSWKHSRKRRRSDVCLLSVCCWNHHLSFTLFSYISWPIEGCPGKGPLVKKCSYVTRWWRRWLREAFDVNHMGTRTAFPQKTHSNWR